MKNFNNYYIKQKENEFRKLEEKKFKLSREIEQENIKLINNKEKLERLNLENEQMKNQYNSLKDMAINRGIVLGIENKNYKIKEWDNLFIEKKGNKYILLTKNREEIYSLEKDDFLVFQDLFSEGYSSSVIVIRVTPKLIKVQVRFVK